jgi:hypothetical protein
MKELVILAILGMLLVGCTQQAEPQANTTVINKTVVIPLEHHNITGLSTAFMIHPYEQGKSFLVGLKKIENKSFYIVYVQTKDGFVGQNFDASVYQLTFTDGQPEIVNGTNRHTIYVPKNMVLRELPS